MKGDPLIVLIDGDCALCDATAVWFARRNSAHRLIFATNTGVVARVAGEPPGGDQGSVVVWFGSRRLTRSSAALEMIKALGGAWSLLAMVGKAIPRGLRDRIYDEVARRRRRLNRPSACKLLSPYHLAE
ncbi:MAG: DCC1-like thiol-disulfide oxidoreductase family protein [Verrucomicrobia bacterium]|nr:DCC1-like thiol-disulfide oxidoreductase family protein [Verrucomicrobiota bacterium]